MASQPTVPGPSYRVSQNIANDIRLTALLTGVSESELVRRIVSEAIRRRLARWLKGQTVEP